MSIDYILSCFNNNDNGDYYQYYYHINKDSYNNSNTILFVMNINNYGDYTIHNDDNDYHSYNKCVLVYVQMNICECVYMGVFFFTYMKNVSIDMYVCMCVCAWT